MENLGLPTTFQNIVICKNIENKEIVIRSNIKNADEVKTWVEQYGKNTATSYILRSLKKRTEKVAYMRFYLCHHASYKKLEPGEKKGKSQNYFCKASIRIMIKNNTRMTRQKDPYLKTGLIAVITIRYDHSHSTKTMEAYSRLCPTEETKQKFPEYFEGGHSNSSAMKECKHNPNVAPSSLESSKAQINPTYRTVRYWHGKWLKHKFGSADETSTIQTLRSRSEEYRSTGNTILVNENPFAVVIITPLMRRAHCLSTSADIVFADSTTSCDLQSHVVTVLLTTCAIGAVPLGVIITKGQSADDYKAGLELLKHGLGDEGFNRQAYPHITMTDDSEAERIAFSTVWPDTILLLCQFHVCQTVWRWLTSSENCIPPAQRSKLYQHFNKILTSITKLEAIENFNLAKEGGKGFCLWLSYLENYWQRRQDWCLAWRDQRTHGHQSNKYAEKTIRLLKDKVLDKYKAHNAVELVDKVVNQMEQYYIVRLKNFANGRDDRSRLQFEKERRKASYLTSADVTCIDKNLYIVRSESDQNKHYTVDPGSGFCSCSVGKLGTFCKHMAGVFNFHNELTFLNFPAITPQSKHDMAVLAFGSKAGNISLYYPLEVGDQQIDTLTVNNPPIEPTTSEKETKDDLFELFKNKINQFECSKRILKHFIKRCRKISSTNAMEAFLRTSCGHLNQRTNVHTKLQTAIMARRTIRNTKRNVHIRTSYVKKRIPNAK